MITVLLFRWLHILAAIVLVGGTLFQWLACHRQPGDGNDDDAASPAALTRARWSKLVMISSAVLLLSGLYNLVSILRTYDIAADAFPGNVYHPVFGVKFLLAFGVFFLSAALSGRSGLARRLRRRESMWLTVNAVLAILVVLLGGMLKVAPRSEKSAAAERTAPQAVAAIECPLTGRY